MWSGKGELAWKCTLHLLSGPLESHPHAPTRLDYFLLKTTGPEPGISVTILMVPCMALYIESFPQHIYQLPVFNSSPPLKKVTSQPHYNVQ